MTLDINVSFLAPTRQGKLIAELIKTETSPEEVVSYITGAHESLRAEKLM